MANETSHRPRAVTLADVAHHAGFSRSTASLVFQNSPLVADGTRTHVLAAAEELGYVYNRRAAGLRMQQSGIVGLLIAGLNNPFFADLVEAVEEELGPSNYIVLLGNTLDAPKRQADLIRTLLEYRVDGLLVVPATGSGMEFASPLQKFHVPYVVLTRWVEGIEACYVGVDDIAAGRLAAEHLIQHGCGDVAYFGGTADMFTRADRLEGVGQALKQGGADLNQDWTVNTKTSSTAGYEMASALLRNHAVPEGIVCHSDAIAFGVMRAFEDAHVSIGTECRIIGFDDVEAARHWSPSLSSISVASRQMGREAARLLVRRIEGGFSEPVEKILFDPTLVLRESCGTES